MCFLKFDEQPSIAIAYDTRNHSQQFAEDAAAVFSSMGIKAYLFDVAMPTPVLSFTVRHLGCDAGIVVTASHNPKEYNGYKVYDNQGGQLTPDAAREVTRFIEQIEDFNSVKELTGNPELIEMIGEDVLNAFITEIKKQSIHQSDLAGRLYAIAWCREYPGKTGFGRLQSIGREGTGIAGWQFQHCPFTESGRPEGVGTGDCTGTTRRCRYRHRNRSGLRPHRCGREA